MTAYRFCRSDDITLLGDALNRCWVPYFPDEPLMTPAAFKRSIRDLPGLDEGTRRDLLGGNALRFFGVGDGKGADG